MKTSRLSALILCCIGAIPASAQVSLTTIGAAYTQNFDGIVPINTSDGTLQSTLPTGWVLAESGSGANTTYAIGTGSLNTGNTYAFGATNSAERALGGLQSGTVIPSFGVSFTNNTSKTITDLQISYTGEMWRLGTADANDDRLDFQYSIDATSLTTGTWIDVNALDFSSLTQTTVGAKDGNTLNTSISSTVSGLAIAPSSSVWIRWTDFNVASSDDGLAVDNFSLTPIPEPSTYAAAAGLGMMAFALCRRRHRKSAKLAA
jgi:PEP-CTERM motif